MNQVGKGTLTSTLQQENYDSAKESVTKAESNDGSGSSGSGGGGGSGGSGGGGGGGVCTADTKIQFKAVMS